MKYAAMVAFPLFLWLAAVGQQSPDQRGLVSSDLIAWSSMQQPQEPERVQPGAQPISDRAPAPEVVRGSIVKQADIFLLRISESSFYKLDPLAGAERFEGHEVRVIGAIDRDRNLIHVERIELLS